ncbi:mycothiol conjugate amidase Mca [Rothia sp. ZJ932]|uniref:mycothiol conjugate amidase Mca n=1 Tax=Rothia sp. ZJ932 TaxID=2810516 RepID=UPI001966F6BD|nr:mycothiol conjugate amidase Mca [Rothia sp. ZJ932]QRZ61235.1 mycothiol conjugate amidase Mca [Rothia sp. ZJ932]
MSDAGKISNNAENPQSALQELADDYTGFRILAVHAHPDDESSKGAAMMAAYAARGARVMVASMTGGERGDVLTAVSDTNPAAHRYLPSVRRAEMAQARDILGIEHRWIGFMDSGLPEGDPLPPLPFGCFASQPLDRASAPLVRLVRRFKPHVILSYDEIGGYPHPDHIMSHRVAVEAFHAAGDASAYLNEGEPWAPLKLYYDRAFNLDRLNAINDYLVAKGTENPFAEWIARRQEQDAEGHTAPVSRHQTTTRILSKDYFAQRDQALLSHATQVGPKDLFFALTPEETAEVWPTDDYVLIESRVETSLPETDFAAGIDYKER